MVNKLDNSNEQVCNQIYAVFQSAYKVEAQLIGVSDFPPLSRTLKQIKTSKSFFYGSYENDLITGVIEVNINGKCLEIDSLTVQPEHFKKGIGSKLISYVFDVFEFTEAIVETAVANKPAIKLYNKHGFVEFKRWTPSHGIEKLAMAVRKDSV